MVCEEHALFRRAIVVEVERDPQVEVVSEVGTWDEVLGDLDDRGTDVAIIDLAVLPEPASASIAEIAHRHPALTVVVTVPDEAEPAAYEVMRAGAVGVIHKDTAVATAGDALAAVRAGNVLVPVNLAARTLAEYGQFAQRQRSGEPDVPELTEGEQRVLSLVAEGSPATAIAVAARLPPATARNLLRNAIAKMQRQYARDAAAALTAP